MNILVEPTRNNGINILHSLNELGLELPEIKPEEFEEPLILAFGLEPDAIDILNYTPGIDFTTVYANSIHTNFLSLKIRIIDIRSLIKNKEALNRSGEKSFFMQPF